METILYVSADGFWFLGSDKDDFPAWCEGEHNTAREVTAPTGDRASIWGQGTRVYYRCVVQHLGALDGERLETAAKGWHLRLKAQRTSRFEDLLAWAEAAVDGHGPPVEVVSFTFSDTPQEAPATGLKEALADAMEAGVLSAAQRAARQIAAANEAVQEALEDPRQPPLPGTEEPKEPPVSGDPDFTKEKSDESQ